MPLEKHIFTTGVDQDSEDRMVAPTSWRYALNIRSMSSDGQNEGLITNAKGNTLVQFNLPSGINKVIGSYEDKTRGKVYYDVYNSFSNHSILEYTSSTNTIVTVIQSPVLNFDPNFLITGIDIVEIDENTHLKYWTDDNEEPKKINIEKGILHSQGDFINGYPSPFLNEYIYRIKRPDLHPPVTSYQSDPTRNVNLLEGHLYQFATQYVYDDHERSAKSPISVPPLNTIVCGGTPATNIDNNIKITFQTGTGIVNKIIVLARDGNLGDFFQIALLDKSILNIPSNSSYSYNFYNDEVYNFIDINESIKLFDNIPLKAKAEELVDGVRGVFGNILEGEDNVDINAKLSLTILGDPSPSTLFGWSGKINIGNLFVNTAAYQWQQPIHSLDGNEANAVFGGFGPSDIVNTVGTGFAQTIPLGGWVVYLVGTPYYTISQQTSPSNVTFCGTTTIFNSDTGGNKRSAIRNAIESSSQDQVYSFYVFTGVPPGKYIMRIASHLTTQAELGSGNIDWQRSSTNTLLVGEWNNHECPVEVTTNGTIIAGNVTTTNGGEIGRSLIVDLTNPKLISTYTKASAITGYVTDKDISPISPGTVSYLADTRIELAKTNFKSSGPTGWSLSSSWNDIMGVSGFNQGIAINIPVFDFTNHWTYSDHNGYIYFSAAADNFHLVIQDTISGIYGLDTNDFKYDDPPTAFINPPPNGMTMGIFRSADSSGNVEAYSRTLFNGNVQYNGVGVSGISITTTQGGSAKTIINGQFELPVYVDTRRSGYLSREGTVFYNVSDNCIATFSPSSDYYSISILTPSSPQSVFVSPYNGTYDYINNTLLLQTCNILVILGAGSTASFKRGSIEQFGIVYYDHGNRSGLTNTNDNNYNTLNQKGLNGSKLIIPFFTEIDPNTSAIYGGAQPVISWEIFNQPPIWATHYQWVRTLNSVPNRYLQFTAKDVQYTDNSRAVVTYTQATLIAINMQNIANYANLHGDSVLNFGSTATAITYLPAVGDRIRFIKDVNGIFFNKYVDLKIVFVDPAGIAYVDNDFTLGVIHSGCLFEIYTPKLKSPTQIYYEIGECYDIGDAGLSTRYHKGQTGDQSSVFVANPFGQLVSTVPAIGTFSSGDTYWRLRNIPYGITSPPDPLQCAHIKSWYIEDSNFSDFYKSQVQNIGRPNKVDRDFKQIRRKSTIYYTEKFIPETQINGLSSVYDTSFKTYESRYGGIQKLFNYNLRLDCYQELKVGTIPINQIQMQSTAPQGADVVGTTSNVLNPIQYYQGEFGIGLNPESFANYANSCYFFDLKRGAVLRKSNDGIFAISNYKKNDYFTELSNTILSNGIRPNVYGVYDFRIGEYIMAFETNSNIPDVTLSFSEDKNSWSTDYDYLPEGLCTNGVDFVAFKDGNLYLDNNNPVHNNFFGVQYNSEVWVVINGEPSKNKVLAAISLESTDVWEAYEILTPNGQKSNLIVSDFAMKQNMWYAAVKRDENTPNVINPLIEGDVLVDTTFLIKLRNTSTSLVKLFAVNAYWQAQERSNK